MIKIPGTGGGFGANGSDGGVDGTFGVELISKCMCITSCFMRHNDSLSVVICRPSQRKRERERKRGEILCFVGERDNFFSKARKD